MSDRTKAIVCIVFMAVLITFCVFSCIGCATTSGALSQEVVTQSAAVDTSINALGNAQTQSAIVAEQVDATAQQITEVAKITNNKKLSALAKDNTAQIAKLKSSQENERKVKDDIQTEYTQYKETSQKELKTMSEENARLNNIILKNPWKKRFFISVIIIAVFVLLTVFGIVWKIYFHK